MIDPYVWSTIVLGIWGALGPLVGVQYGHVISKRWQKEHWLTNSKKEEYREVLQVLSNALGPILQYGEPGGNAADSEEIKAATLAENSVHAVLENRLFINSELEDLKAQDRWASLVSAFTRDKNVQTFSVGYKKLTDDIRKAAL